LLGSQTTLNPYVKLFRSLVGLHIARFGGYPISWLYFIAGLISTAMIAAGLVFFTIKRRNRYNQTDELAQTMYRAIEALNVTVIAGLIIACTAFLWGNRLLPAGLLNRADAEIQVFFITWLFTLLHAFKRTPLQAWREQLSLAAGLCLGLPLLNTLTTNVGLSPSIRNGDWMTAGVDLTAALMGILFALAAWQITLKQKRTVSQQSSLALSTQPVNR